ncbi:MAG: NAD(P)/FAD-dependent oxidoreductase [Clostridiales bacterium]|jgi:glycerol-3-phosphate dehydrogenase|nr:NAD(P)/FAD-dependent oxidoreductase [Clostridiales bacterium]
MYDCVIIGAGIIGAAAARELSRYRLKLLLIDKAEDVSCGASKANSGIVHAGYDCEPGSLKAALNVEGARMYETLVRELDIPYRRNGSLVLCFDQKEGPARLRALYDKGRKNGVAGLSLISGGQARALEPNLSGEVTAALLAESAAVISPYEAVIAFAENAYTNGAEFIFNTEVTGIARLEDNFSIKTTGGDFVSRTVINAAGTESDTINNLVSPHKEEIYMQRGQYYLIDKAHGNFVSRTIFQLPTMLGKGVLITSTVDGNLLVGPNAENFRKNGESIPNITDTTRQGLAEVCAKAARSAPNIPVRGTITVFAGLRAKAGDEDFHVEEPVRGFVNALGIDSPGLSAAPAIARKAAGMVLARLEPPFNPRFVGTRSHGARFAGLSFEEQARLVERDSRYGHVVCRCETVTEGEIVDAIHRPLGARTLDGLKRRTRARMGRCQGGFCTIRLMEILSRELGIEEREVTISGKGSRIIL